MKHTQIRDVLRVSFSRRAVKLDTDFEGLAVAFGLIPQLPRQKWQFSNKPSCSGAEQWPETGRKSLLALLHLGWALLFRPRGLKLSKICSQCHGWWSLPVWIYFPHWRWQAQLFRLVRLWHHAYPFTHLSNPCLLTQAGMLASMAWLKLLGLFGSPQNDRPYDPRSGQTCHEKLISKAALAWEHHATETSDEYKHAPKRTQVPKAQ